MGRVLKLKKSSEGGIKDIFCFLLESKRVKGVLTLKQTNTGQVHYSLVTKTGEIDSCRPLYPLMPVNAARVLVLLMERGPLEEPVAVFIRPCELRALVELTKLDQTYLKNLFIISLTCPGVYPVKTIADNSMEKSSNAYRESIISGEIPPGIRSSCRACNHFIPYGSDITLSLIGKDIDSTCDIWLHSDMAKEFLKGMDSMITEEAPETAVITSLKEKRALEQEKLFAGIELEDSGINGLIDVYGKCTGCYGCRSVCPFCYCTLCFFDSGNNESSAAVYEREADKRGAIKVPSNTLFYHIGRMSHIGISCVGCGSCSDVCPVNIPLAAVIQKAGSAVQALYDYIPGKKVDEKRPLGVFKEEELSNFEN